MLSIRLRIMTTLFSRVYQQGLPGHRSPVVQLRSLEESFRVMLYPGGMQTHTTIEEKTVVVHYRGETLGRIRMPIWATRDDLQ